MANFPPDHIFFLVDGEAAVVCDVDKTTLEHANAFYKERGYCLCRIFGMVNGKFDEDECTRQCAYYVWVIMNEVVLEYPRKTKPVFHDKNGAVIEWEKRENAMALYEAVNGAFSITEWQALAEAWPPGISFGALTSKESLHNSMMYDVRQNKTMLKFGRALLEHFEIVSTLDRSYGKHKGGMKEDKHLDGVPRGKSKREQFHADRAARIDGEMVAGKLGLNEQSFWCCPGSQSEEAHERILADNGDKKLGNSLYKIGDDFECIRVVCKRGIWIAFRPDMVHMVQKRTGFEFGAYIGWQDAWPRKWWSEKCGINEWDARITSITNGEMMEFHPSGFPCPYLPYNYIRIEKNMKREIDKRPDGHPSITTRKKVLDGSFVPSAVDYRKKPYVMPDFSAEAKVALGLITYDEYYQAGGVRGVVLPASNGAAAGPRVVSMSNGGAGGGARASGGAGGAAGGSRAAEKAAAGAPGKRQAVASDTESDSDSDDGTAAGAPAAKRQAAWQCASCTLINDAGAHACEACLTMRQV